MSVSIFHLPHAFNMFRLAYSPWFDHSKINSFDRQENIRRFVLVSGPSCNLDTGWIRKNVLNSFRFLVRERSYIIKQKELCVYRQRD